MDSEVISAMVGAPAVLITAAAAWLAGRTQSQGAYQGPVDAVRRTAQREAYADLYRAGRHFIDLWERAEVEHEQAIGRLPRDATALPPEVRAVMDEVHEAQNALERAVDMVRLEGPEELAQVADRIWDSANSLAGVDLRPMFQVRSRPLMRGFIDSAEGYLARTQARSDFTAAHRGLLSAARRYLNGGASTRA
jgi:hypothetical protein